MLKSEKDGAQTSLYLALSSEVKGVSGCYFMVSRAREKLSPSLLFTHSLVDRAGESVCEETAVSFSSSNG